MSGKGRNIGVEGEGVYYNIESGTRGKNPQRVRKSGVTSRSRNFREREKKFHAHIPTRYTTETYVLSRTS